MAKVITFWLLHFFFIILCCYDHSPTGPEGWPFLSLTRSTTCYHCPLHPISRCWWKYLLLEIDTPVVGCNKHSDNGRKRCTQARRECTTHFSTLLLAREDVLPDINARTHVATGLSFVRELGFDLPEPLQHIAETPNKQSIELKLHTTRKLFWWTFESVYNLTIFAMNSE